MKTFETLNKSAVAVVLLIITLIVMVVNCSIANATAVDEDKEQTIGDYYISETPDGDSGVLVDVALTPATNTNEEYGFGFVCISGDIQLVMTTPEYFKDYIRDDYYIVDIQVDSNPVIELEVVAYNETSFAVIDVTRGSNIDGLFEQMLAGAVLKAQIGNEYPTFSLIGFSESLDQIYENCNNEALSNGFIQPTTRDSYERLIDEGFVKPNNTGFSY